MARVPLAAALLLALPSPAAGLADGPAEAAPLEASGEKAFLDAGSPTLAALERNEHRKRAWDDLSRAAAILRNHSRSTPADRAKLEPRLLRASGLAWWIRQESPPGVLPPEGAPGAAPGAPSGPGGGGRNPFERPGGATPAGSGPGDAPVGLEPEVAAVEAALKERPGDLPASLSLWQGLLARHPGLSDRAPWRRAAAAAGEARESLKALYREVRGTDPDAVRGAPDPDLLRVLTLLGTDLESQDSSVRERAGRLLGALGAGDGVPALAKAFAAERAPQAWLAMGDALAAIGGGRAVEALGRLADDRSKAGKGLEWLRRVAKRHAVERRVVAKPAGAFTLSPDPVAAREALDFIVSLGGEGATGLVAALATPHVEVRVAAMGALADTKNPAAAKWLCGFLVEDESPTATASRDGAKAAIQRLGTDCVPYMIPALRNPRTRHVTGELLRAMTGQNIADGRPDDWAAWWKKAHPEWKGEAQ
jgi:HEAT repeat protein